MNCYLKVTAYMQSPIAGELPFLDAILEYEMAQREGKAVKIRRWERMPEYGEIRIPVLRRRIGDVLVPCCSGPIAASSTEYVERFGKRLSVERASLLADKSRTVVSMSSGYLKAYHLPLRIRNVSKIVWFAVAERKPVLSLLKSVHSLGHNRGIGYGRVVRWEAERIEDDFSWFAPSSAGFVLMRPLPLCADLPSGLIGWRRDFGAVQPPMWHPDRYMERVVPC